MPYITIFALISFFLLDDPWFIRPFIYRGGPRWLSEATILTGVIVTCLFARALAAAEIRAISLRGKLREDKAVDDLINVALSRIGFASLWATLIGLVSLSVNSVPDEATIISILSAYVTLGALTGFALCLYESALVYWSSHKIMRASGMDAVNYILSVKVPDSAFLIPVVVTTYNLFPDIWVFPLSFMLWLFISLRPTGGMRAPSQGDSPSPD
jgi:hypothetical protein